MTKLLQELDNLKKEIDNDTEDVIKAYEAESVTSEMTQIYQKIKDKRIVIGGIIGVDIWRLKDEVRRKDKGYRREL